MEDEGRMQFIYQYSLNDPIVSMALSPESTLGETLDAFERFLLAAGYSLDGHLEINGNIDRELQDPNAEKN